MEEKLAEVRTVIDQRGLFGNVSLFYTIVKRIVDIVGSLVGIILLSPVFIITALLIKLNSPGGVFFIQERNGYKGRIFRMLKFRSMVSNAEMLFDKFENNSDVPGNMFKMRLDPRVTSVGRIIRKTSIDELPQLFNILKGDMSIVGPRPPIPREVVKYDAWHDLRLSVKPGLTGLWQVSGRNEVGFEEMVRLDLKYIRERSLINDFKIILRTIPVLLGDSKAY
ncbi:MAG TPA: sugar transferase [Clostridia bacterium]|nr:sugar transferase [Clostridia bacterium]